MLAKLLRATVLLLLAVTTLASANTNNPIICNQQYALCNAAHCVPDPNNPKQAICSCSVYNNKNLGYLSCEQRKPYVEKQNGTVHIASDFSFDNIASVHSMQCPSGTPWTNCVDAPCTVDPLHPQAAICTCPILRTGKFYTYGGNCDTSTCKTGFWSGALIPTALQFRDIILKTSYMMIKASNIDPKLVSEAQCVANSPK